MVMSEEARKANREYLRKWRKRPENKQKPREYQRRYREKKAMVNQVNQLTRVNQ